MSARRCRRAGGAQDASSGEQALHGTEKLGVGVPHVYSCHNSLPARAAWWYGDTLGSLLGAVLDQLVQRRSPPRAEQVACQVPQPPLTLLN